MFSTWRSWNELFHNLWSLSVCVACFRTRYLLNVLFIGLLDDISQVQTMLLTIHMSFLPSDNSVQCMFRSFGFGSREDTWLSFITFQGSSEGKWLSFINFAGSSEETWLSYITFPRSSKDTWLSYTTFPGSSEDTWLSFITFP